MELKIRSDRRPFPLGVRKIIDVKGGEVDLVDSRIHDDVVFIGDKDLPSIARLYERLEQFLSLKLIDHEPFEIIGEDCTVNPISFKRRRKREHSIRLKEVYIFDDGRVQPITTLYL